jgi:hypothetical protein
MDAELESMGTVFEALRMLDADARKRVTAWVDQRLAALEAPPPPRVFKIARRTDQSEASPARAAGRGLTALRTAILLSMAQFSEPFTTAEVAAALAVKGEGAAARNVSQTIHEWEKRNPKLVTSAGHRPSGALGGPRRRLYRLTAAGVEKAREAGAPELTEAAS